MYSSDRSAEYWVTRTRNCGSVQGLRTMLYGKPDITPVRLKHQAQLFYPPPLGGINAVRPQNGWSKIVIPGIQYFELLS